MYMRRSLVTDSVRPNLAIRSRSSMCFEGSVVVETEAGSRNRFREKADTANDAGGGVVSRGDSSLSYGHNIDLIISQLNKKDWCIAWRQQHAPIECVSSRSFRIQR